MKHLVLYEILSTSSKQDNRTLELGDILKTSPKLQDFYKQMQAGIIEKQLSSRINKHDVNKALDLVGDRLILLNEGFPRNQILGKEYYYCLKRLLLAEIFNLFRMRRTVIYISQEVCKIAEKKFFLNIVFQAHRLLYVNKYQTHDVRSELASSAKFLKYLEYYRIEKSLEIDHNRIFQYYSQPKVNSNQTLSLCNRTIEKYSIYENRIPSFYFHNYYYLIINVKHVLSKNHDKVLDNAIIAQKWLEKNAPDYTPGRLIFLYVQIVHHIQKKDFAKCASVLRKGFHLLGSNSPHWYRLKENELLMFLHSEQYQKACTTFLETYTHKMIVSVMVFDKERWDLYEAYVNFLLEVNMADYSKRKKHFSILRYINEAPKFVKDKRAMNIPILIIQMLFLIVRGKLDEAIDRIDALAKYTTRYLVNDDTFRSNCFIKMLIVIPQQGFNRIAVERASKKYYDRLVNSEIQLIDQPFEIEIIPYENLWEIIMHYLSSKGRYPENFVTWNRNLKSQLKNKQRPLVSQSPKH